MTDYKAPLRDFRFSMEEVFDYEKHFADLYGDDALSSSDSQVILDEYARFCEGELVPLYRSADEEGCAWNNGEVTTPNGFKAAYDKLVEAGWTSMAGDPNIGGQGLPPSLAKIMGEVITSANVSFGLYLSGQAGAIETLSSFGTPDQRQLFEKPLISGQWNATMCLTEPHCGTDLGLLRTKAVPQKDGSYSITGTKIFITAGEHDLTDNIIHIVLARLPDAPSGTKGISLFIVPKQLVDKSGSIIRRNTVTCGAIEQKMGIKGSATCVMNFDAAEGYLLGEVNKGLHAMFTFMNTSRTGAAVQGVAHAELGFQKSLAYARERLQMRSLSSVKNPDGSADPIIVHPDVRRMLMTQKAFAEGNRMMIHYLARDLDIAQHGHNEEDRIKANRRLDLMTPIAKGFATETGFECANLAIQCFGGHGFIRETGVEQNLRDCRISMLYEGTTGIQALDLINRKVLGSGGELLAILAEEIVGFCNDHKNVSALVDFVTCLLGYVSEWQTITQTLGERAMDNLDETGAASVNYLMFSGYVCLAYFWLKAAAVSHQKLSEKKTEGEFYRSKLITTQFYFDHILPRADACLASMRAGSKSMMSLPEDHFSFL